MPKQLSTNQLILLQAAIVRCRKTAFAVAATLSALSGLGQPSVAQEKTADKADIRSTEAADADQKPANLPKDINKGFLDPDLDVEAFINRFEVESREVVACRKDILASIELQPGMSVGDIGAGTGLYMAPFSKAVGPSGRVFAVDISPKFVKHLRERARQERLDNVEVVYCSDRSANLKPDSIDRAFICDVYHHFEYPQSSMKSIYEALRPGGKLVLVDFHRDGEGERKEWLMNHIRAPQSVFKQEIVDAGFEFDKEIEVEGFKENYLLVFSKVNRSKSD